MIYITRTKCQCEGDTKKIDICFLMKLMQRTKIILHLRLFCARKYNHRICCAITRRFHVASQSVESLATLTMTYLTNMYMPVGSSALETAFQLAITVNFCLAVSGSRGSVAAGGGGGDEPSFPA